MTPIERVARAIAKAAQMPDNAWVRYKTHARAALEALMEPTEAMIVAGMDDWLARSTDRSRVVKPYQAMINKALEGE